MFEGSRGTDLADVPTGVAVRKRRWVPQLVWLVPIVTGLIGGSLAVKTILEKGPTVTILFKTAEGLEAGKTKVKFKSMDVGQVKSLKFNMEHHGVVATVEFVKEAEPYLESAFAITPTSVNQIHLAIVRAKEGRVEEAVRMFANAHVRSDFTRADSEEAVRELAKATGGQDKLQAMLGRVKVEGTPRVDARAIVLADASGNILDSQTEGPGFPGVAELLKSLKLPVAAWPGFALRTVRSIEFINEAGHWVASDSYVGTTPPPPPCSTPTRLIEITRTTPVSQSISCAAAF